MHLALIARYAFQMELRPRANPISLGALLGVHHTVVIAIGSVGR